MQAIVELPFADVKQLAAAAAEAAEDEAEEATPEEAVRCILGPGVRTQGRGASYLVGYSYHSEVSLCVKWSG